MHSWHSSFGSSGLRGPEAEAHLSAATRLVPLGSSGLGAPRANALPRGPGANLVGRIAMKPRNAPIEAAPTSPRSVTADHIFIGYAWEDRVVADWLTLRLTAAGYRVWCDRFKMLGGERFPEHIDDAGDQVPDIPDAGAPVAALLAQAKPRQRENPSRWRSPVMLRPCSSDPNRSGKSGRYLKVRNCASEKGVSLLTRGRE